LSTENSTLKVKGARDTLADILEVIENIDHWCLNNADAAINNLHDRWANICSKEKDTELNIFIQQCEEILADCEAFRDQIAEQCTNFTNEIKDRQPLIKKLTTSDNDTKLLMEQVSEHWNEHTHPQLITLYEKLEELEQSIRE
jgi:hypothetical protein